MTSRARLLLPLLLMSLLACGGEGGASSQQRCGLLESQPSADAGAFASNDGYTGLTLAEARELAKTRGVVVRVVGEDGKCTGGDSDLQPRRVNLYLEDDRVAVAEAG